MWDCSSPRAKIEQRSFSSVPEVETRRYIEVLSGKLDGLSTLMEEYASRQAQLVGQQSRLAEWCSSVTEALQEIKGHHVDIMSSISARAQLSNLEKSPADPLQINSLESSSQDLKESLAKTHSDAIDMAMASLRKQHEDSLRAAVSQIEEKFEQRLDPIGCDLSVMLDSLKMQPHSTYSKASKTDSGRQDLEKGQRLASAPCDYVLPAEHSDASVTPSMIVLETKTDVSKPPAASLPAFEVSETFAPLQSQGGSQGSWTNGTDAFDKAARQALHFNLKEPNVARHLSHDEVDHYHETAGNTHRASEHSHGAIFALGKLEGEVEKEIFGETDTNKDPVEELIELKREEYEEGVDVTKPRYHVDNLYFTEGLPQAIARSDRFFQLTMFVIVLNAIYLGIAIDSNDATNLYEAEAPFLICEMLFCVYFTLEWIVRFLAFRHKHDCLIDFWFKFDSLLVFTMVVEAWVIDPILLFVSSDNFQVPTRSLRLLRLIRLTRMARLARSLPELVTIGRGIFKAIRAVASTVCVLFIMVYVFSITMRMVMDGEDDLNRKLFVLTFMDFTSLPRTMWTLGQCCFMLDSTGIIMTLLLNHGTAAGGVAGFLVVFFVLLCNVTITNMLIGIIMEVMTKIKHLEKEELDLDILRSKVLVELQKHDDGDGLLSREELIEIMSDPDILRHLSALNINIWFIFQMQKSHFPTPDSKIRIKDVIDMMIQCRGNSAARVDILLEGLSVVVRETKQIRHQMKHLIPKRIHTTV